MGFSAHSSVTGSVFSGCAASSSKGTSRGVPTRPPIDNFQPAEEMLGFGKCSRTKNNSFGVNHSSRSEKSKLLTSGSCARRAEAKAEANNVRRDGRSRPPSPGHFEGHL